MVEEPSALKTKQGYWSQLLFMVATSAVLLYGIAFLNKNFFFVIYIFWFEALIHAVFNYLRIRKAGKDLTQLPETRINVNKRELTLADYNNRSYYSRFYLFGNLFLLFTYWVFIIVMIGFVIPLSMDNNDMFIQNIRIMFFRDSTFVLALFMFLAKSFADYYNNYLLNNAYQKATVLVGGSIFDKQNLVMHISLILGVGCWFLVQRTFPAYSAYIMVAVATVFVIIKLLADVFTLNTAFNKPVEKP